MSHFNLKLELKKLVEKNINLQNELETRISQKTTEISGASELLRFISEVKARNHRLKTQIEKINGKNSATSSHRFAVSARYTRTESSGSDD